MNEIYGIPETLVFSPCKVDGNFWREFHTLLSYLGRPEELYRLSSEDPKAYAEVIDCLVTFVRETESELFSKGHLVKKELSD